jgi:hypothetical protein
MLLGLCKISVPLKKSNAWNILLKIPGPIACHVAGSMMGACLTPETTLNHQSGEVLCLYFSLQHRCRTDAKPIQLHRVCCFHVLLMCPTAPIQCWHMVHKLPCENTLYLTMPTTTPLTSGNAFCFTHTLHVDQRKHSLKVNTDNVVPSLNLLAPGGHTACHQHSYTFCLWVT